MVTYDKSANALIVSDLRLSCVYGAAAPSPKDVEKITLKVGESQTTFDVLESAWNTTNDFKPGDSVVLLLTADGKVAGMASPNSKVRSNAVGEISSGGVKIFRPDGGTLDLKGTPSNTDLIGLVTVSANKNTLSVSRLSSSRAPGDYQASDAKLGDLRVASDVRVYERANNNAMAEVKVDELPAAPIPAGKIASYRQNSSGIVDFIVLEAVTGNAYEYGMMKSKPKVIPAYKDENGDNIPEKVVATWTLERGDGDPIAFVDSVGYSGKSGDMVGVITGNPRGDAGSNEKTLAAIIKLTEVKNVKSSDFFTSQDGQYVTTGGQTYRVASDVECCHSDGGSRPTSVSWLTGETGADRLNAIRAYSDDLTIYVDPVGRQVRVIKAN